MFSLLLRLKECEVCDVVTILAPKGVSAGINWYKIWKIPLFKFHMKSFIHLWVFFKHAIREIEFKPVYIFRSYTHVYPNYCIRATQDDLRAGARAAASPVISDGCQQIKGFYLGTNLDGRLLGLREETAQLQLWRLRLLCCTMLDMLVWKNYKCSYKPLTKMLPSSNI